MKIPKSVKILGMNYDIEQVEYISREELKLAQIDYIKQKIYILSDLEQKKKNKPFYMRFFTESSMH